MKIFFLLSLYISCASAYYYTEAWRRVRYPPPPPILSSYSYHRMDHYAKKHALIAAYSANPYTTPYPGPYAGFYRRMYNEGAPYGVCRGAYADGAVSGYSAYSAQLSAANRAKYCDAYPPPAYLPPPIYP